MEASFTPSGPRAMTPKISLVPKDGRPEETNAALIKSLEELKILVEE